MTVAQAIAARRSIRAYKDQPVEQDKLDRVLNAGRLAPSANNMQDWKFIVVRDAATRGKLVAAAKGQKFVGQAPVVIAACAAQSEKQMSCGQMAHTVDVTIAVDHMTLQAVEEGLGTCWIGAFYPDRVKEILGVPEDVELVIMLTLGYPDSAPPASPRMDLEQVVCYDQYA